MWGVGRHVTERRRSESEHAALRRIATLAAKDVEPHELFATVAEEVGRVVDAPFVAVARYEPEDIATVCGTFPPQRPLFSTGRRVSLEGVSVLGRIREHGEPARIDDYTALEGEIAHTARSGGIRSGVGVPIVVAGRIWGSIVAWSTERLPEDFEARLSEFTELLAAAIANAEATKALALLAEEQSALRRVATLVAAGAAPAEVFDAVAMEVGKLLDTDIAAVGRYDSDETATAVGSWSPSPGALPVGTRSMIGGRNALTLVAETGRPARVDGYDDASGEAAEIARSHGLRSSIAAPIIVDGRPWGVMLVATQRPEPFPAGAEDRLSAFTDLVATAIANAEAKSELAASRRRIVAAADEARRRIERDLHDGTQQRLVSLAFSVRAAKANLPPERDDLRAQLSDVAMGLAAALEDLQGVSRGIHPAILSKGGLGPALQALAHRSTIPVDLDITTEVRLPEPIEVAAYYAAAEALTNVAKHAQASVVHIGMTADEGALQLVVRDDGVGGADASCGSGIVGLKDRVEALGGTIAIDSSAGNGTCVVVTLPIASEPDPGVRELPRLVARAGVARESSVSAATTATPCSLGADIKHGASRRLPGVWLSASSAFIGHLAARSAWISWQSPYRNAPPSESQDSSRSSPPPE